MVVSETRNRVLDGLLVPRPASSAELYNGFKPSEKEHVDASELLLTPGPSPCLPAGRERG